MSRGDTDICPGLKALPLCTLGGKGIRGHRCGFLPVFLPGTMCLDSPKVSRGDLLLDLSVTEGLTGLFSP